jgi:hypothetical protein
VLPFTVLLKHSFIYGGLLSLLLTCIVFATLIFYPRIWLHAAPIDIQQAVGVTVRDRHIRRVVRCSILGACLALIGYSIARLFVLTNGQPSFFELALSVFLILQVWNVVDLLLIDWLLLIKIRPSCMMIPGAEYLPGYGDYGFHFRGFIKGLVGSLAASVITAGITALGQQLFG